MTHAIIKNQDGSTYVSPLFALKLEGTRSAAIGLDASLSHVQKLDFWHRNVEDHTLTEACSSYPPSTPTRKRAGTV